jgi:hypothetical protein
VSNGVKNELRKIIRTAACKTATAPEYRLDPHQYIIAQKCGPEWKVLADAIKTYGEWRTWLRRSDRRRFRYKYLILDSYCYWLMSPVLNRAKANTVDKPR